MDILFAGLGEKNLMAKFNRFSRFATNDQLGMLLKQAIEFFIRWNCFALDNAAMGLVNDLFDQRKIMAQLLNRLTGGKGFLAYLQAHTVNPANAVNQSGIAAFNLSLSIFSFTGSVACDKGGQLFNFVIMETML